MADDARRPWERVRSIAPSQRSKHEKHYCQALDLLYSVAGRGGNRPSRVTSLYYASAFAYQMLVACAHVPGLANAMQPDEFCGLIGPKTHAYIEEIVRRFVQPWHQWCDALLAFALHGDDAGMACPPTPDDYIDAICQQGPGVLLAMAACFLPWPGTTSAALAAQLKLTRALLKRRRWSADHSSLPFGQGIFPSEPRQLVLLIQSFVFTRCSTLALRLAVQLEALGEGNAEAVYKVDYKVFNLAFKAVYADNTYMPARVALARATLHIGPISHAGTRIMDVASLAVEVDDSFYMLWSCNEMLRFFLHGGVPDDGGWLLEDVEVWSRRARSYKAQLDRYGGAHVLIAACAEVEALADEALAIAAADGLTRTAPRPALPCVPRITTPLWEEHPDAEFDETMWEGTPIGGLRDLKNVLRVVGNSRWVVRRCATCSELLERVRWCGSCHRICYCSAACQLAHWSSGHKLVCCRDPNQAT